MTPSAPGSAQGLHLVVTDLEAARAELIGRGVDVSEPFHFGPEGPDDGPRPPACQLRISLSDPDGNEWLLQEVKARNPEREW